MVIGGAEATFLVPHVRNGLGTLTVNGVQSSNSFGNTNDNLVAAPRVWLGVQGPKWGGVVRFWQLNTSDNGFNPLQLLTTGAGVSTGERLEAYTLDAEVTRRFELGCWDLLGSFGFRHAQLDSGNQLTSATFFAPAVSATSAAFSSQEFEGNGITFSLFGKRQIFEGSGLHVYFGLRGSALWGDSSAGVLTRATVLTPIGFADNVNAAYASGDNAEMFIGEIQAGLQWDHELKCICGSAFVRGGFEWQTWDSDRASNARAASLAAVNGLVATAAANSGGADTNFVGFVLGAGLTY